MIDKTNYATSLSEEMSMLNEIELYFCDFILNKAACAMYNISKTVIYAGNIMLLLTLVEINPWEENAILANGN